MATDTERLDWLESKAMPGNDWTWIVRPSSTGRSYRIHQTEDPHSPFYDNYADGVGQTLREAIDNALQSESQ